ncbi:MAG TPA: ATP-binding cassette domain-containing protein [Actinomycetes bacterium]|nr:ATP-binding cassette domain-containing protein [Actinomycetes bacterium]
MIRFEDVTITYEGAARPVLAGVDLVVPEGELCLVVGPTGSGKSTLLRAVNGLVPHFSGGRLAGRVSVGGRDTRTHPPRELADLVGIVGQDPLAGFVADVVEEELAYGMESLGVPADVMRRRVEETLDLLGLADLRRRPLLSLSGGQRQRVALGAVLTMHPKVLLLDEPTSALDPPAAEEVLAALQRLVHDLGLTVLVTEHRLERVVQYADRVVRLTGDGGPLVAGDPATVLADSPVVPPVVELGRIAGWDPLPLSVRDARRRAAPLRERLTAAAPPHPLSTAASRPGVSPGAGSRQASPGIAAARGLSVRYGATVALRAVDLAVGPAEVVAVMGRNGAGKSTLLQALVGAVEPDHGEVRVGGVPPDTLTGPALLERVGLVPQDAGDLLWAESVTEECAAADRDAGVAAGTTYRLLAHLAPGVAPDAHPRDLSEGGRLALALAVVLAADPPLLLLDEPTRGLDYPTKARLVAILAARAAAGHAVVLATHDVELVAEVATRVVVLADGEVVADGPTTAVITSSPAYAPQVAKVFAPLPWLTVADAAETLRATG